VNSLQQNKIAERKIKHLKEVTRSPIVTTNEPSHFWGEVVLPSANQPNKMPSKTLNLKTLLSIMV